MALRADEGRREMEPAGSRWLPDGRGGVRYRFDGRFPRRGCGGQRGARTHLTSFSFTVSRCGAPSSSVTSVPLVPPSARSACPQGARRISPQGGRDIRSAAKPRTAVQRKAAEPPTAAQSLRAPRAVVGADAFIGPLLKLSSPTGQRQRKEKQFNAMTTPTTSAPSATGRQYRPRRR